MASVTSSMPTVIGVALVAVFGGGVAEPDVFPGVLDWQADAAGALIR